MASSLQRTNLPLTQPLPPSKCFNFANAFVFYPVLAYIICIACIQGRITFCWNIFSEIKSHCFHSATENPFQKFFPASQCSLQVPCGCYPFITQTSCVCTQLSKHVDDLDCYNHSMLLSVLLQLLGNNSSFSPCLYQCNLKSAALHHSTVPLGNTLTIVKIKGTKKVSKHMLTGVHNPTV